MEATFEVDVSGALVAENAEERERREEEEAIRAEEAKLEGDEGLTQKRRAEDDDHRSVF
jgi:hypothetical protein